MEVVLEVEHRFGVRHLRGCVVVSLGYLAGGYCHRNLGDMRGQVKQWNVLSTGNHVRARKVKRTYCVH